MLRVALDQLLPLRPHARVGHAARHVGQRHEVELIPHDHDLLEHLLQKVLVQRAALHAGHQREVEAHARVALARGQAEAALLLHLADERERGVLHGHVVRHGEDADRARGLRAQEARQVVQHAAAAGFGLGVVAPEGAGVDGAARHEDAIP